MSEMHWINCVLQVKNYLRLSGHSIEQELIEGASMKLREIVSERIVPFSRFLTKISSLIMNGSVTS